MEGIIRHSDTYKKLFEAKFFLNRMIDEYESDFEETNKDHEYTAFPYYISAFLSAFRSITYLMQTEFNDIEGFKEWYETQQKILAEDATLKQLNTERVNTIHIKMLKPVAVVKINSDNFEKYGDIEPEDVQILHSFKDAPEYPSVIDQCKYAIEKITPVVLECEKRFFKDDGSIGSLTINIQ
ncbi:MAG: hypothetical protein M1504_02840 [Candidatus Marsarchaeota archaeon]|nr:hypothetical protein [Candidatus Marsarchaeota archaeon]